MKYKHLAIFWSLFTVVGICNMPIAMSNPLPEQTDKIAQVKSGTLKEAHASWWGFDKDDATDTLQNAIDSGVPKLIVNNMGSDWIVGAPIKLRSNQEITFEDGVVVQAKKGKFHSKTASLFLGNNINNFKLIGKGEVVFRMHRADYSDPELYEKAEWRNGISLRGISNAVIRNLTVTETGGDGLYLGAPANKATGHNKNILVEDCNFIHNYRQGISVISAENLTIRRCKMNYTAGTAPAAGIDFEPNNRNTYPGQRLINCVVEDSEMIGNEGSGFLLYSAPLIGDDLPLSITVRNCKISGNKKSGISSTVTRAPVTNPRENPVKGEVVFENIVVDDINNYGLSMRNPVEGGARHVFKNITLDYAKTHRDKIASGEAVPVNMMLTSTMEGMTLGGVEFDNVIVKNVRGKLQSPVRIQFETKGRVSDQFTGTLFTEREDELIPFDLTAFVKEQQKRANSLSSIADILKRGKASIVKVTAEQAPKVDGILEENIYNNLSELGSFVGYGSLSGSVPIEAQTHVFAMYDDNNLYISVRADEPNMKAQMIAGEKEGDSVWNGESIDIGILQQNQRAGYNKGVFYHFILNPNNVAWHGLNKGTMVLPDSIPTWKSATSKDSSGWSAEIAVPWESIGIKNVRSGLKLYANIARKRQSDERELSSWSQYVSGFQEPHNFGVIELK